MIAKWDSQSESIRIVWDRNEQLVQMFVSIEIAIVDRIYYEPWLEFREESECVELCGKWDTSGTGTGVEAGSAQGRNVRISWYRERT